MKTLRNRIHHMYQVAPESSLVVKSMLSVVLNPQPSKLYVSDDILNYILLFCDEESQHLFLLGMLPKMPMLGDLSTLLKLHLVEVTLHHKLPAINLQNWYFNITFDQFGRICLKRLLSLDYDKLKVSNAGEGGCRILIVRTDGRTPPAPERISGAFIVTV